MFTQYLLHSLNEGSPAVTIMGMQHLYTAEQCTAVQFCIVLIKGQARLTREQSKINTTSRVIHNLFGHHYNGDDYDVKDQPIKAPNL